MKNCLKRVLSTILCSALLIVTVPVVPVEAFVNESEELTISNHLREAEERFRDHEDETGIQAQLYLVRQLFEYSLWVRLDSELVANGFYSTTKKPYTASTVHRVNAVTFLDLLDKLNQVDDESSDSTYAIKYKSIKVPLESTESTENTKQWKIAAEPDDKEFWDDIDKTIDKFQEKVFNAMEKYYKRLPEKDYDKSPKFSEYKDIAGELWKINNYLEDELDDLKDCADLIKATEGNTKSIDVSVIDKWVKEIKTFREKYSLWYSLGQANEMEIGVTNNLTFDRGKTYLENIANVKEDVDTGKVATPPDPELTLLYLACFASSAVYVPFHSHTGDTIFSQALGSLADNAEVGNSVLTFYNKTKNYKKPLYARELNAEGNPMGPATLISINEFIERIEEGTDFCMVNVQGDLLYSGDIGDWVYTDENRDLSLTGDTDSSSSNEAPTVGSATNEEGSTDTTTDATTSTNPDPILDDEDSIDPKETLQVTNVITAEKRMNEPIFMSGTSYNRKVDNTTLAVMTNILHTLKDLSEVDNPNTEYLYMNMFGDIVDKDDLVILPAAANPLYYAQNTYYPFTSAFMNTYPNVLGGTNDFRVSGRNSVGKYIFMLHSDSVDTTSDAIQNFNQGKAPESVLAMKILSNQTLDTNSELDVSPMYNTFEYNEKDSFNILQAERHVLQGSDNWSEEGSELFCDTIISASNSLAYKKTVVFPYDSMEDTDYTIAKLIASGLYRYLAKEENNYKDLGRLNNNYIIHYVGISGFEGTSSVQSLLNSLSVSYDNFINNTADRMLSTAKKASNFIFEALSGTKSVLGINSFYEDPITGTVADYFLQYWMIVMLFVMGICAICILRYQEKLRSSLFMLLSTFVASLLLLVGLPVYGQFYYNLLSNDVANSFTSSMIGTEAETQIGESMEFGSLGSLTVYRYPIMKLRDTYEGYGVEITDASGGNVYPLDKESGFYLEGDCLKYDLSTLFSNITIRASKKSITTSLVIYREVDDNLDYYTPFVPIMECMTKKLNTFAKIYSIPRATTMYKTSQTRTQYLMYDYVNSDVFTKGKYKAELPLDTIGMTEDDKDAYLAVQKNLAKKLTKTFGTNEDWLGLTPLLTETVLEKGSNYQDTVWFQSMERKGIYKSTLDKTGNREYTYDAKELAKLIFYVNMHTRDFVYKLDTVMDSYSDDTIIKLTALKATQLFSQYLSQAGNYVYPVAYNNSEYRLGDVITNIFVSDYSEFKACEYNLVEYLGNKGVFTLVLADIAMVVIFLLSVVNRVVLLVGYYLFVIIVLIRMMTHKPLNETFVGFLKAAVICVLGSFVTVAVLFTMSTKGTITIKAVVLALVSLALLAIYLAVARAVLKDLGRFGNSRITLKGFRLSKNRTQHVKGEFEQVVSTPDVADDLQAYTAYKSDSSLEDIYKDSNKYN